MNLKRIAVFAWVALFASATMGVIGCKEKTPEVSPKVEEIYDTDRTNPNNPDGKSEKVTGSAAEAGPTGGNHPGSGG